MEILDLVQGSDEWLEARLKYLCASEAPAMMGDSKFMSRKHLLDLKKGWKANPAGYFKEKLFEKGHEHEASQRSILEIELCEDITPIVGLSYVDDLELLSSFDGLIPGVYQWEHKDWNEVLAENVRNCVLEPMYYWQLEHQLLVSGEEFCMFMVSDGTTTNRVSMMYASVPERRQALIAGWKQFVIDLDSHELEAKKEVVVASKQAAFPAIECRVEGSLVVSNLGEYIPVIKRMAQEQMSVILQSDQDFADKEAFNKNVVSGRASLKLKAGEIEKQFESLAEFNGFVSQADSILQKLQSHGEKQVKDAKATKKLAITNGAQSAISKHLETLSKTINGVQIHGISADWASIIKGKRSFEKMQEAVDTEIAKLKIQANEIAATIRANLDSLTELAGDHKFLFNDHADLVLKDNDDLVNLIKMRISEHEESERKRLEVDRVRIQAEEEEKAQRAADELAEQGREKIRQEERVKAQEEEQAKRDAEKQAEEANKVDEPAEEIAATPAVVEANPVASSAEIADEMSEKPEEKTEVRGNVSELDDLLSRIPHTNDGVPILWGDVVYYDNPDAMIFTKESVLSGVVESISLGVNFEEYSGTHTILTSALEQGNLDCYSKPELVPLEE